ncbi:MAG: chorismate mutase [Candidatus Izemoplasmatales bacterium]|jgi:monofunctional chorismate mutase
MEALKTLRDEIDQIDQQMGALFIQRMNLVDKIAQLKMDNDMTVYDQAREQEVILKNLALIKDDAYASYYHDFLEAVMKISRDFQKALIFGSAI